MTNDQAEKSTKMVFKYHYNSLTEVERIKVRDEFLNRSGISYTTFYGKINCNRFSKLEREALDNICQINFDW